MDNVKDRIVQYANRYKLTDTTTGEVLGTFDFDEVTGTVTEAGTEINKALFDSIAADFTAIVNGTQPVGTVGAIQLTNEDLNTLNGGDYWGKTYYAAGGNSVINKPDGVSGFYLEILRGGVGITIQKLIATQDTTGKSLSPNIYIRQWLTNEWTSWEQIVTAEGSYPTLGAGKSETLTEPFTVGKDTTTSTTGYVKFASVSLPSAYCSASARFEVLDKNPVNAQTQMCGLEVVVKNINTTNVDVVSRLLYGSSAYLSKIYACIKKGSYPVIVDLYFDITSSNPQETISCIKPLFTFTRVTGSTTFTFITDNEQVSALPTDTTNTQLSTVCVLVTEAADSEKLNGKAASDIFESDGVTAKKATNAEKLNGKAASEYALIDDIPNVSNFAEKNGTYSDMTVGNAYKLGNKAASEYALANDIPNVSNFAEKTGTYSGMTVGNAEKLNGKAASDIFESDGVTAKEATNAQKLGNKAASEYALIDDIPDIPDVSNFAEKTGTYSGMSVGNATNATNLIPDENGAVNPLGRKDGAVVGAQSTALGGGAEASGSSSTALGPSVSASGDYSTALGYGATSSGDYSTALGYGASTAGLFSTALGNSSASGDYSTALGTASASGDNSTALGNSSASGDYSTALGYGANCSESDTNTVQLGGNTLSALRCKVNLTVTSDKRDKTDIEGITDALAFIERLTPVTFVSNDRENYISEEDKRSEKFRKYGMCDYDRVAHAAGTKKGERRRCGLLAQEVIAAMQEVYGTDNYANIVNDNFHDLTDKPSDVENKYTLAYANLVPFLIGAIKELNAKIKELEGRNNV